MKKLRFLAALWAAKLSVLPLKVTGHNGTNFPGVIALKLCPDFLKYIGKPEKIIGVTGTNGKTTVCNIAADMFSADGKHVLNNGMGSNINSGISTALIMGADLLGRTRYDTALLEIDERSAPVIFPYVKPDILLVTNLFRDSVMRNAHPAYIARILTEEMPKKTMLLLNGDDLITSNIAPGNRRTYFGIDRLDSDTDHCVNLINDMQICPRCGGILKYERIRYHHIGKAYCPDCGFRSPECDYSGENANLKAMTIDIKDREGKFTCPLLNDSIFNIYNVVAVAALFRELGYSGEKIAMLLGQVNILESRYSEKKVSGYTLVRQMSKDKNALGASRVFDYISGRPGDKELILMMNCLGDAKHWSENICWLYDADFEFLNRDNIRNIVVTGPRARDYYLRLKIAGLPDERITFVEKELDAPRALRLYSGESIYVLYGTDSIALGNRVVKNIEEVIGERGKAI